MFAGPFLSSKKRQPAVSSSLLIISYGAVSLHGSHRGSRASLPTLKPHLTAPAPRLNAGCSLRFSGSGLSPDYITRTELAHPRKYCTMIYFAKSIIFQKRETEKHPAGRAITENIDAVPAFHLRNAGSGQANGLDIVHRTPWSRP